MELYNIVYKPHLKLRIFATLIDYGIYFTLAYFYVLLFGEETSDGGYQVTGLAFHPIWIFWIIYFVGLEAFNSATPGHDVFKLKVTKMTGEKIGFKEAFKRRICDPLDIFFYGIPAIICITKTDKHQRIGDLFAGTVIVKKDDVIETKFSIS